MADISSCVRVRRGVNGDVDCGEKRRPLCTNVNVYTHSLGRIGPVAGREVTRDGGQQEKKHKNVTVVVVVSAKKERRGTNKNIEADSARWISSRLFFWKGRLALLSLCCRKLFYLTKVLVDCRCAIQAVKTSLQWETTHSLLQYSWSQSWDSMAGLGQPVRVHSCGGGKAAPALVGPPLEAGCGHEVSRVRRSGNRGRVHHHLLR